MQTDALVVGAGPAGLMAAEALADAGRRVLVLDQKPSPARKFLMAGKSGLNLTKDEPQEAFQSHYDSDWLAPMLRAFGPEQVQDWARGLGQEVFTGSTGRVFPKVMKASPLLRNWLSRLADKGVELRTRHRWTGWDGDGFAFDTPGGALKLHPTVAVLACGGGSWARLGSDGAWTGWLEATPFLPSNTGLNINWSEHMTPHFGAPIKSVNWIAWNGSVRRPSVVAASRGEAILSERGLEGGGIYPLIPALRSGAQLALDLFPDIPADRLAARLPKDPKRGLSKILRNTLRLSPAKHALAMENIKSRDRFVVINLSPNGIAQFVKSVPIRFDGLRPIDEAISTAGGLRQSGLSETLMLKDRPGVFACGEMLDWDAPTGGYLITACLATGLYAGQQAANWS